LELKELALMVKPPVMKLTEKEAKKKMKIRMPILIRPLES
jgi:hypothetical protein